MSTDVIERPLYVIIALVVVVVILPVVAGISLTGVSASSGLISMNATIASFMPIFGLGLSIGLLFMFIALATILKHKV